MNIFMYKHTDMNMFSIALLMGMQVCIYSVHHMTTNNRNGANYVYNFSIVYMHVYTDLDLRLGEVAGVGSDGGVGAARVCEGELVEGHEFILVHLLGRLDGRGTFPSRATAAH